MVGVTGWQYPSWPYFSPDNNVPAQALYATAPLYGGNTPAGVIGYGGPDPDSATNPGVIGYTGQAPGVWGLSSQWGVLGQVKGTSIPPGTDVAGVLGTGYVEGDRREIQGVLGISSGGLGVWGLSDNAPGVSGESQNGDGVFGQSYQSGDGVFGLSQSGVGVHGRGATYGVSGVSSEVGTSGYSATGIGILGATSSSDVGGWLGTAGGFIGPVVIDAPFTITGPKGAAVPHPDGTRRILYSLESPESWFEDFGEATLANGKVDVEIDPDFAAVVRTDSYHVFVTPYGDSKGLYVADRNVTGFEVCEQQGGTSNLRFSYRIVAKRKDIEGTRLSKFTMPKTPSAPVEGKPAWKGPRSNK